ncbi:hypothetical protein [Phyllobacterium zundukense]|uniref:Uncharacterized protein n=1 Tax=Phyllobacterium zundukense TaxID=1867719 RepID=A0ACD4CZS9_9HYPH|nr:hypothetical protein [Phyllobacterium zundukense]UXN59138.1 hypothetical protein N8E88_09730 [Phyllobacterium zundukense]
MMRTSLKGFSSIIAEREAISLGSAMRYSTDPGNRASSHPAPQGKAETDEQAVVVIGQVTPPIARIVIVIEMYPHKIIPFE